MKTNKIAIAVAFSLTALSSFAANAELVVSDWKTAGDNSIITDTTTGLSWLNLKETDDMTLEEVVSKLDTDFSGWNLPTETQVHTIYDNYFNFDVTNFNTKRVNSGGQNFNDARSFADTFGNGVKYNTHNIGRYFSDEGKLVGLGVYTSPGYALVVGTNTESMVSICTNKIRSVTTNAGAGGVMLVNQGGIDASQAPSYICGGTTEDYTSTLTTPIVQSLESSDGSADEGSGSNNNNNSNDSGELGGVSDVSTPLTTSLLSLIGLAGLMRSRRKR